MLPEIVIRLIYNAYRKEMDRMFGCIFCRIAAREKPGKILYEDEKCFVLQDINPQAPVHLLVIPHRHITSLNEDSDQHKELLGHLLAVAARMAKQQGIDGTGYRVVINTNAEAGQTVFHLHVHLLGGRVLRWPPG